MRVAQVTVAIALLASSAGACVLVTNFEVGEASSSSGSVGGSSSTASTSATSDTSASVSSSASTGAGMLAPFVFSADLSSATEAHLSSVIEGPNDSIWFAGRYAGTTTIGASTLQTTSGDFFVGHVDADGANLSAFTLGLGDAQSIYDGITLAWNGDDEIWFLTAQQNGAAGLAVLGNFDPANPTTSLQSVGSCTGSNSFQHAGLAVNVPVLNGPTDVAFGFSTNGPSASCTFSPLPDGVPCTSGAYDAPASDEPDTLLWYARRSIGVCYGRRIREESAPSCFQSVPRLAIDPVSLNILLVGRYTGHLFDSVNPIQTADPTNINVANEFAAELAPSGTSLAVLADWDLGGYDDPGGAHPSISPTGEWLIGGTVYPLAISAFQQDATKLFQNNKTSGYVFRAKPSPTSVSLWTASAARSSVTGLRAYTDRSLLLGTAANEVPLGPSSLTAPCHAAQSGDCYSAYWAILDTKYQLLVGSAYGVGSGAVSPADEPRYVFLGGFLMKDGRVALGGQMGGADAGSMVLGGQPISSAPGQKTMFLAALDPSMP